MLRDHYWISAVSVALEAGFAIDLKANTVESGVYGVIELSHSIQGNVVEMLAGM